MFGWLENLGTTLKLASGFGLVLALTMVIAATGWFNIGALLEGSERLSAIGGLVELSKDLRSARINYQHSGSAADGESVDDSLDALQQYLQGLRDGRGDPQAVAVFAEQIERSAAYRDAFTRQVAAYAQRTEAGALLSNSAQEALEAIGQIEQSISSNDKPELYPGQRLGQFRAIVSLGRQLGEVRHALAGYIHSGDLRLEQQAIEAIATTTSELQRRLASASATDAPLLRAAEQALLNYQQAIDHYRLAKGSAERAGEEMRALDDAILESSKALSQRLVEERKQESQQAYGLLSVASLLALLCGVAAALLITRQIVNPLRQTLSLAERIAGGDLSPAAEVTRRDELGQLQRSMRHMTDGLRQLVGQIREGVGQLDTAAHSLTQVTQASRGGIRRQNLETGQVATAIGQMAGSVQEVARHAEAAAQASRQADSQAGHGDALVDEAIGRMDHLAGEMNQASAAMDALLQESHKIGGVMDVIKGLAEQTNLLALNAAIEAARAGEAGRGFAVVADEVRNLAQRTQRSAAEIEQLITGMQSLTSQTAARMGSSKELTGSSVELVRRAGQSLNAITRSVSSIQSMNQQIAAAAEQQSVVADEIQASVDKVRGLSEDSASASEATAAASAELLQLGQELHTRVSRFQV